MERKRTYDDVAATVQAAEPETLDESATPLSEAELKKRQKALQKLLKKESDLKIIVEANQTRFRDAALA
jgi:hypothetical protein